VGKLATLTQLKFNNGTVFDKEFDVTELGSGGALTTCQLVGSLLMKGSLDKLGMSPITSVVFPSTKNVSISIEAFVAYNRAAERTTGSVDLKWVGSCDATFNGASISVNQEHNYLSWDATTITFNGETITA
jgi:hypothetical protein